jgi:hypothetical protein
MSSIGNLYLDKTTAESLGCETVVFEPSAARSPITLGVVLRGQESKDLIAAVLEAAAVHAKATDDDLQLEETACAANVRKALRELISGPLTQFAAARLAGIRRRPTGRLPR